MNCGWKSKCSWHRGQQKNQPLRLLSQQVGRRKTDKRQSSEALKRIDQPGTQDDRRRQLHGRLESAVSLSQPIQAELRDASDIELPVSIHDRLLTDADIRATKLVCSD